MRAIGFPLLRQTLKDRVMLTVDGQKLSLIIVYRLHKYATRSNQGLFVRQKNALAGFGGSQRRRQSGRTHNCRHDGAHSRIGGGVRQGLGTDADFGADVGCFGRPDLNKTPPCGVIGHHDNFRLRLKRLRHQFFDSRMRTKGVN